MTGQGIWGLNNVSVWIQQEIAHSKGLTGSFNEGTSYRGVDRLTELMRDSGHPGTIDSRRLYFRPNENKG